MARTPPLGSLLLGSTDPDRLRDWYEGAFDAAPDPDGFQHFGDVAVLIDGRDDVEADNVEPGRTILNFHVPDARAATERLRAAGATVLIEPEWRGQAWFATALDPDGNCLQVIQLSPAYWEERGFGRLARGQLLVRLPAQDLDRARAWYAEKLDLHPEAERPGAVRYRCGSTTFALFASTGRPSGTHTQMGWQVDDVDATVAELRRRGVVFEDYDVPGLTTVDGIAAVEGNYPDEGSGERAAWFHDSEGNLLGIGQAVG